MSNTIVYTHDKDRLLIGQKYVSNKREIYIKLLYPYNGIAFSLVPKLSGAFCKESSAYWEKEILNICFQISDIVERQNEDIVKDYYQIIKERFFGIEDLDGQNNEYFGKLKTIEEKYFSELPRHNAFRYTLTGNLTRVLNQHILAYGIHKKFSLKTKIQTHGTSNPDFEELYSKMDQKTKIEVLAELISSQKISNFNPMLKVEFFERTNKMYGNL